MLDSTFSRGCEAAAARWEVPSLAIGWSGADAGELTIDCTVETRFRVASVTKPMTASLALQLLDLDAATGVWPDDVRVRHLLTHTSGFDSECGDLSRFGDGDDALDAVVRELTAVRRFLGAGELWSYANSGYWLAGWLSARAADAPYEDLLRTRVLEPAGMHSTDFGEPDLAGTGPEAVAGPYPRARRPSGGVVSTVADLLRFARRQLSGEESDDMRVPYGKPIGGVYGLGYFGERVAGVEVWGHPGSYGGFQSSLLLVPARHAAFVGLTNSGRGKQALREIEDLWFARLLGAGRSVPPTVDVPTDELAAVCGVYANAETGATVATGGDGLVVSFVEDGRQEEVTGRPVGPRTFEIVGGDHDRDRFDFPRPGFARFGSRLAQRVE